MAPGDIAFKSNFATLDVASGIVLRRRADRRFEELGPVLCAALDGLRLPSFPQVRCQAAGRAGPGGARVGLPRMARASCCVWRVHPGAGCRLSAGQGQCLQLAGRWKHLAAPQYCASGLSAAVPPGLRAAARRER